MQQFKLITVDAYSALLNLEGSMVPLVARTLNRPDVDALNFFRTWRGRQWDYVLLSSNLQKGYHSYEYLTRATLGYTLKKFAVSLDSKSQNDLVAAWSQLQAWPEAKVVFTEVKKRGCKIAILSNGDEAMLRPLQQSTGIEFDFIFCAEQAQAYKPDPRIYALPLERNNYKVTEVLHVAGSMFDLMGAKSAGLYCAWSNRNHEYTIDERYCPDFNWNNLSGLLDIV